MPTRVKQSSPDIAAPRSFADMTDAEFAQRNGPAPNWLQRLWADSEARGLDKMTMEEIGAEIEAYRAEKRVARRSDPR